MLLGAQIQYPTRHTNTNTIHDEAYKYKYNSRQPHMRRAAAEHYRCVASRSPEWGLGNNAGHDQNQNCGRTLPRGHIRAQQIRATVLQVELLLFSHSTTSLLESKENSKWYTQPFRAEVEVRQGFLLLHVKSRFQIRFRTVLKNQVSPSNY